MKYIFKIKMVSHKSKYFIKNFFIFVIFTFFVYSLLLCYVLSHLNTQTIRCNIAITTVCHWASLQICEVRHCQLSLTLAKQILMNKLKVGYAFFSQTTTHMLLKSDFAARLTLWRHRMRKSLPLPLPFIYFFHQAQRLNYAQHAISYTISRYCRLCTLDIVLDEVMAKD